MQIYENIILHIHKKHMFKALCLGKDNFMVAMHQKMHYAFIVALIVILDEINQDSQGSSSLGADDWDLLFPLLEFLQNIYYLLMHIDKSNALKLESDIKLNNLTGLLIQ